MATIANPPDCLSALNTLGPVSLSALYFTKPELSEELKVSERTLDRWDARRMGPPRIKIGAKILFPRAGVVEWLNSRTAERDLTNPRRRRPQGVMR